MQQASASRAPLQAILAFCIIPILFHLVIVETSHIRLSLAPSLGGLFKLGFVTASAVTHWGIYSSLLLTFGLTLRPKREPLITAMARHMQGELPDEMLRYTRKVTIAWCCFFATQLTLSVTLFCFAPLVVWSAFVNIFDIPLVITMFAAEYWCRLRCLHNPPRQSLPEIISMVMNSRQPAGKRILPSDAV
jgi:uncharacterized membrane protein